MEIQHDRLVGAPYVPSPNVGGKLDPIAIVLHFTAGGSGASAVRTLTTAANKVSAHCVLDKAGPITQLVPFNRVAWHAGTSKWGTLVGLNKYAIGLEFDNCGWLVRREGSWFSGATHKFYPDSEVIEARHKNGGPLLGWHKYPDVQIDSGLALVSALLLHYKKISLIVGHDDIAPGRKQDPGPAFPMERFQALLTNA